jgi:hypothetical protein
MPEPNIRLPSNDTFSSDKVQLKSVKNRVGTPIPLRDDVEWLELEYEAELMREIIIEEMEEEISPVSVLKFPSVSIPESDRPSLPAFRNFQSLASRRARLNAAISDNRSPSETVIYSTVQPSVSPLKSMLEASKPSLKLTSLKLSFAAQCFIPGRNVHDVCRDSPSTPYPRCSLDAEDMFSSAI